MRPLKIAQVTTTDMAMRFLLMDQIKCLQGEGHEVIAVCGQGPWVESLREQGIAVEVVKMARELRPFRDVASFFALMRCFRKHRFDVVHTHTPKAGLLAPLAAKIAGVRMVVHTIHGLLFHDQMRFWKRLLFWIPEKITALFSDVLSVAKRRGRSRGGKEWFVFDRQNQSISETELTSRNFHRITCRVHANCRARNWASKIATS